MKFEIFYGILAAISWSIYVILLKIALRSLPLKVAIVAMSAGIFLASLLTFLIIKENITNIDIKNLILVFISGILWFLGIFIVNYALKKGLNLSVMAPIYNINTILVVLLAIAILHENVIYWKVILASILVTIAAILIS